MLRKSLVLFVAAMALSAPIFSQSAQRTDESIRKWREDLSFLKTALPAQHPRPFHDISMEEFDRRIDDLSSRVPKLSDAEVITEIGGILAALGPRDGHTHLNFATPAFKFHFLPLRFYDFSDGLFLRAAAEPYAAAVGGRLVAIGSTPVDVAWKRSLAITPGDNEINQRASAVLPLIIPELLRGMGIVPGSDPGAPVKFTFEMTGGKRQTIEVKPLDSLAGVTWSDARASSEAPLYLQHGPPDPFGIRQPEKLYFFQYLADSKVLYVEYNAVANAPDESIADFFKRVFAFADSHEVDRFVLDVRNNGGGNNFLNRPILLGLIKRDETINRPGHLFVIIGRETFSAAQNLVTQLEKYTDAIFVGEPTGGSPNQYGDARPLVLPNSGLPINVATLWWQDSFPNDPRLWIAPRLSAELSSTDYAGNHDPALQAVLNYSPVKSLTSLLRAAMASGGKSAAAATLTRFRSDPLNKYTAPETEINGLGYELIGEKNVAQATAIFELNTEAFPRSWNAFDSLGEAYVASGKTELAVKAYEHALELNPGARSSRAALEALRKK